MLLGKYLYFLVLSILAAAIILAILNGCFDIALGVNGLIIHYDRCSQPPT